MHRRQSQRSRQHWFTVKNFSWEIRVSFGVSLDSLQREFLSPCRPVFFVIMMHCLMRWFVLTKGLYLLCLIPYIPFREWERQIHHPQYWNRINLVLLSVSPSNSLKQSQRLSFISGGYKVLGLIIVLWISTCIVHWYNSEMSGWREGLVVCLLCLKSLFLTFFLPPPFGVTSFQKKRLYVTLHPHRSLPLQGPSPSWRPLVSIDKLIQIRTLASGNNYLTKHFIYFLIWFIFI